MLTNSTKSRPGLQWGRAISTPPLERLHQRNRPGWDLVELVGILPNNFLSVHTDTIWQFSSSPAHQFISSPVHQLTSSPAHQFTSSPAHQLTCSPVHQLTSSPAHQLTSSPAHQFTSSPAHQLTSSPAHQLTRSSWFPRVWRNRLREIVRRYLVSINEINMADATHCLAQNLMNVTKRMWLFCFGGKLITFLFQNPARGRTHNRGRTGPHTVQDSLSTGINLLVVVKIWFINKRLPLAVESRLELLPTGASLPTWVTVTDCWSWID